MTMGTFSRATKDGEAKMLQREVVQRLRESLRGRLLTPEDDGYDSARQVWNGMIDRKPAMIVQCAGVADVITAVSFAREHDLLTSIRGGGHNVAGAAVADQVTPEETPKKRGFWSRVFGVGKDDGERDRKKDKHR